LLTRPEIEGTDMWFHSRIVYKYRRETTLIISYTGSGSRKKEVRSEGIE
jgi:hypothetical protein